MAGMNVLLNRDFKLPEDGWFHLVPLGEYPHPKAVQVVDAAAAQAICNRFAKDSEKPNFPGILVDFDHFSDDVDQKSEAAGWVTELQNRTGGATGTDGVWGRVRWSDAGEAAVKGGRYRLASPVWLSRDCEVISNQSSREGAKARRVRPLRLHKVALTNDPNMKGMVPLSNRGTNPHPDPLPSDGRGSEFRRECPADSQHNNQRKPMKSVAVKLGLSAEASEEAILEAVTKLENRAVSAEQAVEPLKNRVTTLETEQQTLLGAQVEADLAKYANRIKPEAKDGWKAALLANRTQALALLDGLPEKTAGSGEQGAGSLTNRATAQTPEQARQVVNQTRTLATEVNDYALKNRCTFAQAWNSVKAQKPELFK